MADKDCFSKFFIEGEWDGLTTHQKLVAKLMFIDYLARRSKARDDEEVEKPAYLVRYDKRRAQLMAARRRELAQQATQQNKRKPKANSDNDDGLLRGFTELEISESRRNVQPLKKLVAKLRKEFDSSDSDLSESGMYKRKQRPRRNRKRVNYAEVFELDFDDYMWCDICDAHSVGHCHKHGPLLVIPNRAVSEIPAGCTRAEMSCPKELQIAPSNIPGAGLGVFTLIHMPKNVRFGPYEGVITSQPKPGGYAWQVEGTERTRKHLLDAADPNKSNWLRYVNCARRYAHQNMTTFQYHGKLYYRTIENIPPNTELLIFYGIEYAELLGIDVPTYGEQDVSEEEGVQSGNIASSFRCDACGKTFSKAHLLSSHRKLHERHRATSGATSSSVAGPSNARRSEPAQAEPKPFKCDVCEKRYSSEGNLSQHKRFHSGIGLSVCHICSGKLNTKSNLTRHLRTHTGEKPYQCDTCNARFTTSSYLTTHKRAHTGEKPYQCDTCNARFTTNGELTIHKRVHTGEKPYQCDTCSARFTESGNLTTHKRVHSGEKPYQCDTCNARFTTSSHLTRHKRVHTGEKPYQCDTCNARFTTSSYLTTHKRAHTGEKPYQCDTCNARFTTNGELTIHKRVHTGEKPYQCDTCSARFTESGNLTTHKRVHSGEKPYQCDTCNARFTTSSHLTRHKRVHTGEKPFQCAECVSKFTQRSNLKTHVRRRHPK